jgi:hypothetical protein
VIFDRAYPNSCFATSDRSTCAVFVKEDRMKSANATNLDRNSGERSGGICGAPLPQTKAPQVSSQIQPKQFVHWERMTNLGVALPRSVIAEKCGSADASPYFGKRSEVFSCW